MIVAERIAHVVKVWIPSPTLIYDQCDFRFLTFDFYVRLRQIRTTFYALFLCQLIITSACGKQGCGLRSKMK